MASICNDDWASLGVMSGHERKPLRLSGDAHAQPLITTVLAPAAGVAFAAAQARAQPVIGLITKTEIHPIFVTMKVGADADAKAAEIVCMADSVGDRVKGQTAMENCLQKNCDANLVLTIHEPAAAGRHNALKRAGKDKGAVIVSVDGGCDGIKGVGVGVIAGASPPYPLKRVAGYTDTAVALIATKVMAGVDGKDVKSGTDHCWRKR